ncbi:MAG: transposase [Bacteroidales bacterium]|nr:transposase [Bacteroidales bacterium]
MGSLYRRYVNGARHHVYNKGIDGNIIFYSVRDFIYYLTLFYHLARHYGISTWAFCIMPNHVHSNVSAPSYEHFTSFHRDLFSFFTREYNKEHSRTGSTFLPHFGYAPKLPAKKIRDNISYIANNPVVGNLTQNIDGYKWNLMAYRISDHPFSDPVKHMNSSYPLKMSLKKLRYYHENRLPLTYVRQRELMKGLESKEKAQLTDRIISMHNCLDYNAIAKLYDGDINNAIIAINANTGNEHDIPEDNEDYHAYYEMMKVSYKSGVNLKTCNFENWPQEKLNGLIRQFSDMGIHKAQISKFLHLKRC